jgi:nuclear transport factor 2 (NTF2) superfamily protein
VFTSYRGEIAMELWAFRENRIAVRFAYEWHDDSGNWFRSSGELGL